MTLQELLDKHEIKHGIENDQARLDAFVKDLKKELTKAQHFDPVTLEFYIPVTLVVSIFGNDILKLLKLKGNK